MDGKGARDTKPRVSECPGFYWEKREREVFVKIKGEGRIKPHLPIYTKHRKGKGQFKRKAANDKNKNK